VSHDIRS
jgi:hypothetical protein